MRLRSNQSGDTIIETVIAITVASIVLFGAYTLTNHNTRVMQETQERNLAVKLAESQLEYLRANPAAIAGHACYKIDGSGVGDLASYCSSVQPNGTNGVPYTVEITSPVAPSKNYHLHITWPTTLATTGSLNMYYRPPGV